MKFDDIAIGSLIRSNEFFITPEMQQNFLEAIQEKNPLYLSGNSQAAISHPGLILNLAMPTKWIGSFEQHLETKSVIEFIRPSEIGETILTESRVHGKYSKRGMNFVSVEIICTNKNEGEIMHCISTEVIGQSSSKDSKLQEDKSTAIDLNGDFEIHGFSKEVTLSQMQEFSKLIEDSENFHINPEIARSAGFSSPIAQGMMSQCFLLEMLMNKYGNKWLNGGVIEVKFINFVYPGDIITTYANLSRLPRKELRPIEIRLDLCCRNQRKEAVAVGTAMI